MSEQNNNEELELDVNKLMQVRKEKLDELQKAGKNPFEVTKYDIPPPPLFLLSPQISSIV